MLQLPRTVTDGVAAIYKRAESAGRRIPLFYFVFERGGLGAKNERTNYIESVRTKAKKTSSQKMWKFSLYEANFLENSADRKNMCGEKTRGQILYYMAAQF